MAKSQPMYMFLATDASEMLGLRCLAMSHVLSTIKNRSKQPECQLFKGSLRGSCKSLRCEQKLGYVIELVIADDVWKDSWSSTPELS